MSNKLNILVAYPYMSKQVIEILKNNQDDIRFLLDSGAFTAWKSGKPIKLDDYCNFIESLPFKPWRYFTLDEIGNAEKTLENYNIMLKRGFKPIPIFTRGEDPSLIEEYYKTSDVVGIGGLVGTKGNKGFVKGIMKVIGNRKVHWLGFNYKNFLAHYRPYMCDSSSWSSAVRYAAIKLYDENGKWYLFNKKEYRKNLENNNIMRILRKYKLDYERLLNDSEWKNSGSGKYALEEITCKSWTKYQIDLNKKLNIKFFLACAQYWQVKLMLNQYNFWRDEGLL